MCSQSEVIQLNVILLSCSLHNVLISTAILYNITIVRPHNHASTKVEIDWNYMHFKITVNGVKNDCNYNYYYNWQIYVM